MFALSNQRRAAVTVEVAVTIPIVIVMLFASIEFCRVTMLRSTMQTAAYEAARAGIVPGATKEKVVNRAEEILKLARASDYTIQVIPEFIDDSTSQLSVLVSVPMSTNGYGIAKFFKNASIAASATKPRLTINQVLPVKLPPIPVTEASLVAEPLE